MTDLTNQELLMLEIKLLIVGVYLQQRWGVSVVKRGVREVGLKDYGILPSKLEVLRFFVAWYRSDHKCTFVKRNKVTSTDSRHVNPFVYL